MGKQHEGWWKLCARSRDRFGIYERLLVRHPDGRIDRTSYLNLPEHPRRELSACFHAGYPLQQEKMAEQNSALAWHTCQP
jgi:hypothetical protein